GVLFTGQLQPPAILRFDPPPPPEPSPGDDDDDCPEPPCPQPPNCIEVKIFSGTEGIDELLETCTGLGILYWKEMHQQ
ncbi:MAG: hypothetical protein JRF72_06260, partial [Deltaproteobacteria bacterium]|nr:hypothetical protein [Deltaproteobacteria bacterium]